MWPPPSNSDHQDYYIFRFGNPNLNLHLPLASWEGATPNVFCCIRNSKLRNPKINDFAHNPWEDTPNFPFHPYNSKEIPKQKQLVKFLGCLPALGIQSYSQLMIGVSNHLLRMVCRFKIPFSEGEPGSLGQGYIPIIRIPIKGGMSLSPKKRDF